MRWVFILVIVLVRTLTAGQDISLDIVGMGTTGPYRLGYTHIIKSSEKIEYKGKLFIFEDDYRINYDDGLISLYKPLALNDTLHVTFSILPISIKPSYQFMKPIALDEPDIIEKAPLAKRSRKHDRLEIIGSKGFAVNIGNRGDPTLSQSLDLDISGQMADGVFIRGSITDQNFGGSTSGGTRSLDELDRIFLSLETGSFKGDFGDIELKGINNSLLDFHRKLTGLYIHGNTGDFTGSSALAFSPGRQTEIFFFGVDGKQGPYLLQSLGQSQSVSGGNIFLPGTEEIYLDGKKLTRGAENDYNIDYYEGYIEFNPRNIISSKSRITVKIQYAAEDYDRSLYNINTFWNDKFSIGLQYLGEKDDKSNPRSFDLGEREREIISQAGASEDSAYAQGGEYVGEGNGDYISETDSSGQSYFVYAGENLGDYKVRFSRAVSGSGDYQYAGSGIYIYVGEGNGSYLPAIFYPLPENKDYSSVILKKDGDFHFDCELAASRNDRNSLSGKDDILIGSGILGNIGFKKEKLTILNRQWNADFFNIKIRSLDNRFFTPGIIDPPEFFRQYNIPQSRLIAGEKLVEIQSRAVSSTGDMINAGGGVFTSDSFDASRGFGRFNLTALKVIGLSAGAELSKSEDKTTNLISNWNKYNTGIRITKGVLQPGAIYRHERNDGLDLLTCFKADEYESYLNTFLSSKLTTKSKLLYRDQKTHENNNANAGEWIDQFHQYQIEQGVLYSNPGIGLTGEANLSRFYQKRFHPQYEIVIRNMGSLKMNYNSRDIGVTFYENVNGAGRISREREYIYVGDGNGDFRLDGDDYIPEQGGDYIEVIRQLEQTELSGYQVSGGFRLRLDGRAFFKKGLLGNIHYENDLSHKTYLSALTKLQPKHLFPFFQYDDEITYRTYNYNQRTTLRLNRSGDFVRHTLKAMKSKGTDFQFENLDNRTLTNIADLKMLSGKTVSYLISAEHSQEKSLLYSGSVDLTRLRVKLVPEFHPAQLLRVETPLELSSEDEKNREVKILSYSAGMKTIINFRKSGRIEINGGYTRVDIDKENIFIPYKAASGKKQGDNYTGLISARFKLNSYSQMELRYNYKKLGDGYSNSNLRLEAKAQF